MNADPIEYGFEDAVARRFNLSPEDAAQAIRVARESAGGTRALRWLGIELLRLHETFTGDESATDAETRFLIELARRSDADGVTVVTRDALAETLGVRFSEIDAYVAWGRWRESFAVSPASSEHARADRYALRDWPPPDGLQTPGPPAG